MPVGVVVAVLHAASLSCSVSRLQTTAASTQLPCHPSHVRRSVPGWKLSGLGTLCSASSTGFVVRQAYVGDWVPTLDSQAGGPWRWSLLHAREAPEYCSRARQKTDALARAQLDCTGRGTVLHGRLGGMAGCRSVPTASLHVERGSKVVASRSLPVADHSRSHQGRTWDAAGDKQRRDGGGT